jgi:hypothetical protein
VTLHHLNLEFDNMAKTKLGKLPPRYKYTLNKYRDERFSRCPLCKKLTHPRKFALLIHIDEWGLMIFGKSSKYCSNCELIIVHQHELEAELAYAFSKIKPEIIGNDYLVIGTVDKKIWQQGVKGNSPDLQETLKHASDFKKYYDFKVEPAGWYFAGDKSKP